MKGNPVSTRWGRPQSGSSILDGRLSERHGSVRVTRTKRDLYCHLAQRFKASRWFPSCVVLSPRKTRRPPAQVGLSSPPTARSSPCAAKPPSQTTNINMGAERRLPARSSPSDRGSSHNRGGGAQDGAARGFPKRWCRDLQASERGPPQQPEEGGRDQWGDATAERVPSLIHCACELAVNLLTYAS